MKFHLNHHWERGETALSLGSDRVRTLVCMATYSLHRFIMGERCLNVFLGSV